MRITDKSFYSGQRKKKGGRKEKGIEKGVLDHGAFECKEIEDRKTLKVWPMRNGGRFKRKRKTTHKMTKAPVLTFINEVGNMSV